MGSRPSPIPPSPSPSHNITYILGIPSGVDDFKLKFGLGGYSHEISDTIHYDFEELFEYIVSK
jgi:hypothetical protein